MLERDDRRRQLLEARHGQLGARAEGDLHRAREQAWPAIDLGAGWDELLEDRRLGPITELDDGAGDERAVRGPDGPADDDRLRDRDAGRDAQDDAVAPARTGELGEAVVLGQRCGSCDQRLRSPARDEVAERLERDSGGADGGVEGEGVHVGVTERSEAGRPRFGHRRFARVQLRRVSSRPRDDVIEHGGPQVDVGRVELVRFDRQGDEALVRGATVGAQPGRLTLGQLVDASGVEVEGELRGRAAIRSDP